MPGSADNNTSQAALILDKVAWPLVVLIVFFTVILYSERISSFFGQIAASYKTFDFSVGQTGVVFKGEAKDIAKGITAAVANGQDGKVSPEQASKAYSAAASAVAEFSSIDVFHPENRFRVLWVDDQPGNNAGLQFALESLGIIVISVEDTDRIEETSAATGGFDVVVTDMFRNAVRGKPDQPDAGNKTVQEVNIRLPNVPVIIYAGGYAAAHQNDVLIAPVKAITNNPETVFSLITQMAKRKSMI